jgi:hypothetical protein
MAIQELWVDPSVAPGGTGTYNDPFDSQAAAIAAATAAEAIVNLKRGYIYAPVGTESAVLRMQSKAPAGFLRLQAYGDAELPPTFFAGTNMLPGDAGWTYVGDGLWVKALSDNAGFASPIIMRLYVGGSRPTGPTSGRTLGTGYSFGVAKPMYALFKESTQAEVLAEVGTYGLRVPRMWMYTTGAIGGNGLLYVWTGSATVDPPTYYDGITVVGSNGIYGQVGGWGRTYGSLMYNCSRVEVHDVATCFANAGLRITGNAASADCGFFGVSAYAFGGTGLLFEGGSAGLLTRPTARNCLIDAKATLDEDWNFRDKGGSVNWLPGTQDATTIGRWTDSGLLDSVTTLDGYHFNTYFGATNVTAGNDCINARAIDCIGTQPNRRYGTLIGAAMLGVGRVATITRFQGDDAVSFLSRTGSGKVLIEDSVFKNAKQPFPNYDANPTLETNEIPGMTLYSNLPFGNIEAESTVLNRCTMLQPYGFMFSFKASGGEVFPASSYVLNDCLVVDTRYLYDINARTYSPGVYDKPGISFDMRDTASIGVMEVNNTFLYTGAANQPRVATSNTAEVTFAAWSGLSGTFSELDPQVNVDGVPHIDSPLLGAGLSGAYSRDVTLKQRPAAPSIGAYDTATMRVPA